MFWERNFCSQWIYFSKRSRQLLEMNENKDKSLSVLYPFKSESYSFDNKVRISQFMVGFKFLFSFLASLSPDRTSAKCPFHEDIMSSQRYHQWPPFSLMIYIPIWYKRTCDDVNQTHNLIFPCLYLCWKHCWASFFENVILPTYLESMKKLPPN